ncbi:MAG: hypothetical protein ACOX0X_03490 [Candidatus Dojkabacteria bacterium]|jgi:hypothetical protein
MYKDHFSSLVKKVNTKDLFKSKNRTLLILLVLPFSIYIIFLSPHVERMIEEAVINQVRKSKELTLNFLTPLTNSQVYAQEYSLNTLSTTDLLQKVKSKTEIRTEDPRVLAMQKFLLAYNSPMYPYAKTFIEEADKYGLDWRLVAAISGVESAFGNLIPRGTNNGWGWRGANKNPQGWSQFATWGEGIATVTRGLAIGYGTHLTPSQIEPTYCPPCGANPAHLWANGVVRFMRELDYYVDNLDIF